MPARGSQTLELLVDTSVAVPLVVTDHEHHDTTFEALADRRLALSGHAAFETFSVLTRLPSAARRTPAAITRLLRAGFGPARFLSSDGATALFAELASSGIAGGSVYDALVGAAAAEHRLTLVTRDRRAMETYRAVEARIELLT